MPSFQYPRLIVSRLLRLQICQTVQTLGRPCQRLAFVRSLGGRVALRCLLFVINFAILNKAATVFQEALVRPPRLELVPCTDTKNNPSGEGCSPIVFWFSFSTGQRDAGCTRVRQSE